jgi:hypothetical protein
MPCTPCVGQPHGAQGNRLWSDADRPGAVELRNVTEDMLGHPLPATYLVR